MQYKIGVFGSSAEDATVNKKIVEKVRLLGKTLSNNNVIIITGACSGLPYIAASSAAKLGSEVWGYSPEIDINEQKKFAPKDDLSIYKKLFFVPHNFIFVSDPLVRKKYRNVVSTANCDGGIIISGRWGTMNEFTNLFDLGKVIGVLTGTGGIADKLEGLQKKIKKPGKAKVLYNNNPEALVKSMIAELEKRA